MQESDDKQAVALKKLLLDQEKLYSELTALEIRKREAIFNRRADELKNITSEESGLATQLGELEAKLTHWKKTFHSDEAKRLSQIIRDLQKPDAVKDELERIRLSVKDLLFNLHSLVESNRLLLEDSREFFSMLVKALSADEAVTYETGNRATALAEKKAVFLDTNC